MQENPVITFLEQHGILFTLHRFEYQAGGGTKRSSSLLGVSEHAVIKTLVFQDHTRRPLLVLMHGDKSVDGAQLAEQIGVPKIWSCSPADAELMSGWPVGATNPFVLKTSMPIYLESSVLDLPKMFINGGGRGCLVGMTPADLLGLVKPSLVRCAKDKAVVVSKAP